MTDVIPASHAVALEWLGSGRRVVAATLVETVGSAPLDAGAEMLVDDTGRIEGSVTGGCVEGALVEEAQAVLAGGPPRVVTYGISDGDAADVGLMCGGTVRLFVHELGEDAHAPLAAARAHVAEGRPAAVATLLDGDGAGAKLAVTDEGVTGTLGGDRLDASVRRDAEGLLGQGISAVRSYSAAGELLGDEVRVYVQSFANAPSMVIFGAIDFSAAVAKLARDLGYDVTICDARQAFASSARYSRWAEVVVDWPDRHLAGRTLGPRDVVLVFTHDPKFDEPALIAALRSGAGYIGALGSRRTQEERFRRLLDAGVEPRELDRIAGPCGLDIGARTPAETAVSVLGEVIARRAGRDGHPLSDTDGSIRPREVTTGS